MRSSPTINQHEQPGLPNEAPAFDPSSRQGKFDTAFQVLQNIIKTNLDFLVKDAFSIDDMEVGILKGFRFKRTEFNTLVLGSIYSVTRTDYCIGITSLSYAPTVGLPSPSSAGVGKTYLIKDEAGGAASTTITIRSAGEATIDGASSATITTNYGSKMLYSDGNKWNVGLS